MTDAQLPPEATEPQIAQAQSAEPQATELPSTGGDRTESVPGESTPLGPVPVDSVSLPVTPTGYTDSGVPTLDYVQERIEGRLGMAAGYAELTEDSPAAAQLEQARTDRARLAEERLAAIRKSMES